MRVPPSLSYRIRVDQNTRMLCCTELIICFTKWGTMKLFIIILSHMVDVWMTHMEYTLIVIWNKWVIIDFVLIIIVQFMMSANSRIRYGLQIVFVCLYITPSHNHHCANLSVDIELMKCLPDISYRVCELDWAYSLCYPLFNIWGCMFSVYPIPSWWLR